MTQEQVPPLRIREEDGNPNAIPVYHIIVSNGTLTQVGPGIVRLATGAGAGGTSITPPLIISSGGTGTTATGSATTLVGMNSSAASYDYYTLSGSNNTTVSRIGTAYTISSITNSGSGFTSPLAVNSGGTGNVSFNENGLISGKGTNALESINALARGDLIAGSDTAVFPQILRSGSQGQILVADSSKNLGMFWANSSAVQGAAGIVYAATGNNYIVMNLAADLTNEYRLVQSGNSITISTDANTIVINAITNAASGFTSPLANNSGGTGTILTGSATTLVGVNSSGVIYDYYLLRGSDNVSVLRSGSAYFFSGITAGLVNSSLSISTVYPISGGGNLSLSRTFAVDTAFFVNTGRTLTAGSGLTGGGNLSADQVFSVNTNVRDKMVGYFFAGSLSPLMLATSAMIYIPFNMELRDVRLAVSHSAGGQNIMIQPTLWSGSLQANSALFPAANRPVIVTNSLVGSSNTLGSNVLHAGSWLGVQIDSVGTTVIASNMTVTFIVRTS